MSKERGIVMKGITLQEMSDETVQQLHANYVRQPAYAHTEGTSSAYTVTLDPAPTSLVDGFGITVVPHVANESGVTLNINGHGAIALKDQRGNGYTAGKLQAGKPYMFRKVGTAFLADSSGGSGNALAGDIRAGKVATTDNGDMVGTLPVRTGGTITPSTVNQTKQNGIYDTDIVVQGSGNLIGSNIKKGINMFGVVGTVVPIPSTINEYRSATLSNIDIPNGATITKSTFAVSDILEVYVISKEIISGNVSDSSFGSWCFGLGLTGSAYQINTPIHGLTIKKTELNTIEIYNPSYNKSLSITISGRQ